MKHRSYLIHVLSSLHAGTGQAVGHIDLPIARYKATGIPYYPGSSLKGVIRDATTPSATRPDGGKQSGEDDEGRSARRKKLDADPAWTAWLAAFGPDVEHDDASEHAGAVTLGDSRLLLLPVRSLRGTFAYVTSPLLLRLASQDLAIGGASGAPTSVPTVPTPKDGAPAALVPDDDCELFHRAKSNALPTIYLEDIDFAARPNAVAASWADWLGQRLFGQQPSDLRARFVIVSDEAMSFLWEMSTQVDAHNRINDRGTVADGQLWWEETLPPETVLLGFASATEARRTRDARSVATADAMLDLAIPRAGHPFLQIGGKATVGKGRVRLVVA